MTLDDALVEQAIVLAGVKERGALSRAALTALIERESARRLARLGGSEAGLEVPERRRPAWTGRYLGPGRPSAGGGPGVDRAAGGGAGRPPPIAELVLGTLKDRESVLGLPPLPIASVDEVRAMVEARGLAGSGIGIVDCPACTGCAKSATDTRFRADPHRPTARRCPRRASAPNSAGTLACRGAEQ